MNKRDEIIVIGAGLSGMTASIVLAKEGRKVKVLEKGKTIGGDIGLHPSLHATPIDIDKVAAWTGLDTDRMFVKGKSSELFIGEESHNLAPLYLIERGSRPTSIDTYLYDEAQKLGVEFEFGRNIEDPNELPKGSIVATGFFPKMFEEFGTASRSARGFFKITKNKDPKLDGTMYLWMGPYSEDYAYACILNGVLYIALFSRFGLPDEALNQFEEHLKATTGWEFDDWRSEDMLHIPCASIKKPRLWVDDYILTGTAGSVMDPMFGFGIHGAILSGVTAAWAVTDPERANKEFKKLNKHYVSTFLIFEIAKSMLSLRGTLFRVLVALPRLSSPVTGFISQGVPGYESKWISDVLRESGKA